MSRSEPPRRCRSTPSEARSPRPRGVARPSRTQRCGRRRRWAALALPHSPDPGGRKRCPTQAARRDSKSAAWPPRLGRPGRIGPRARGAAHTELRAGGARSRSRSSPGRGPVGSSSAGRRGRRSDPHTLADCVPRGRDHVTARGRGATLALPRVSERAGLSTWCAVKEPRSSGKETLSHMRHDSIIDADDARVRQVNIASAQPEKAAVEPPLS